MLRLIVQNRKPFTLESNIGHNLKVNVNSQLEMVKVSGSDIIGLKKWVGLVPPTYSGHDAGYAACFQSTQKETSTRPAVFVFCTCLPLQQTLDLNETSHGVDRSYKQCSKKYIP